MNKRNIDRLKNELNKLKNELIELFSNLFTRNVIILVKKELNSYFNSLIAYVVIVVFLLVCGYFYSAPIFVINKPIIRHFVTLLPLLYLFFIPAITMRLFAEEIHSGTIEILFTQPIKDYEILLGKYFSAVCFITIIILCTLFYPISLLLIGKLDIGQTIAAYIGLILLGSSFAAVGVFSSALTKNQIVAFIISFVICFIFFILGKITTFIPSFISSVADYVGIDRHFENIARGVIDTRDIIYYFSIIIFFLYSTLYVLKTRR
jgi:ABC-2 type transport system permease protein